MSDNAADRPSVAMADEMNALSKGHDSLVAHVRQTVDNSLLPLSEDDIWHIIAPLHSPDWSAARDSLKAAQEKIDFHRSYEYRPLGAIGQALDSDTVNSVNEDWARAQAHFTIIDERLRGDSALMHVLQKLHEEYHMLAESLGISREAAKITQEFAEASEIGQNTGPSPLRKAFGKITHRMFKKSDAARAAPAKRSDSVPSGDR